MKKTYSSPKIEKLDFAETSTVLNSTGEVENDTVDNADVGQGRGRGGGCDGVSYHRNARTFSSGRNSDC